MAAALLACDAGAILSLLGLALVACGGETSDQETRAEQVSDGREDAGTKADMSTGSSDDEENPANDVADPPAGDVADSEPADPAPSPEVDSVRQPAPGVSPTTGSEAPASMNPVPIDPEAPANQPTPLDPDEPTPVDAAPNPPCVSGAQATEVEIARRLERLLWNAETGELAELVAAGDLALDTSEAIAARASMVSVTSN